MPPASVIAVYNVLGCHSPSLGRTSKMPCPSYSLPASACQTGQRLAAVPGSTCASCYALSGNYTFHNVQEALHRRLASITDPLWVPAMVTVITRECSHGFFRWHDSGDIQSLGHLSDIAEIARRTPHVRHWLPTREYWIVARWVRENDVPPNLTIRVSAPMVDGVAPFIRTKAGGRLPVSYVHDAQPARAQVCPAPAQGDTCGSCRACWDNSLDVSYAKH